MMLAWNYPVPFFLMIVTPFDWKTGYDSLHMDTFFISYQMKLLWMIKRAIAFNRSGKRERRTLFSFQITLKWKHIEVPDKLWIIRCLLMQLSLSSQEKKNPQKKDFNQNSQLRSYLETTYLSRFCFGNILRNFHSIWLHGSPLLPMQPSVRTPSL